VTRQQTILLHRWLVALPLLVAAGLIALAFLSPEHMSGEREVLPIANVHDLARDGNWEAAMYHCRQYLLKYPDDPFAHFLLGQCYLYGPRLQLTHADGELETARALHERLGHLGGMTNRMESRDFLYRVYKIRAVVQLRIAREGMVLNLPRPFIERHLRNCIRQLRTALAEFPADEFLEGMREEVMKVLEEMEIEVEEDPPAESFQA